MKTLTTHTLGFTKNNSRLWIHNRLIEGAGLTGGQPISIEYGEGFAIIKGVSEGKSRNHVADTAKGLVIDLNNRDLTKAFEDYQQVQVTYEDGQLVVKGHQHESRVIERETELKRRVRTGQHLRKGGLFAGLGLLCRSIHRGLRSSGINVKQRYANEISQLPAEVNIQGNEIWDDCTDDALFDQQDIFTLDLSTIPKLDLLVMGSPCTPFSKLNTQKRKTGQVDILHEEAGTVFQPMLAFISASNPAIVCLENSEFFSGSIVDRVVNDVMLRMGYLKSDVVVSGVAHGGFEPRKRLCRVYYSRGLEAVDMTLLVGNTVNPRCVDDVLEPMADDDSRWARRKYLEDKDAEAHNGHSMHICKGSDRKLPTFSANYHKTQPSSALAPHPDFSNNMKCRIFTPSEHCNVRRIEGRFKDQVVAVAEGAHTAQQRSSSNVSAAHKMLGNSCSPEPFEAAGAFIGDWIKRLAGLKVPALAQQPPQPAPVPAPQPAANQDNMTGQLAFF